MLRQHSLLLSLVTLFVSISSVWAKNVTVLMDDKRLTFSNSASSSASWTFYDTGLCGSDGGISYTWTQGDQVRLRFNGTAVYVVLAQIDTAAMTNVTIDGVQANVTAQNATLGLMDDACQTRTLFAANLTNTNHTVTVAYADNGLGRTVLNKFIFDDGSDTPKADPTATRASVTIQDTGATPSPTSSSSSSTDDPGCGTHCKTLSIGGGASLLFTLLALWCLWRCCCGTRRTTEVTTVIVRPPSPKPQPIILVAATLEVQETHIQVNSQNVQRQSAVSPPAYEQTNYK